MWLGVLVEKYWKTGVNGDYKEIDIKDYKLESRAKSPEQAQSHVDML